jgi:homoserine kinase
LAEAIHFKVPASTANLGPGFGVLGLALDKTFAISVEEREVEGLVVERPDAAALSVLDLRHDSILRGIRAGAERFALKLPKGLLVKVSGSIPRGTGLGTNSADFTAGVCAALRFAKKQPTVNEVHELLVEIGSDPGHGAAALCGGLVVAVPIGSPDDSRRFRLLPHPLHEAWHFAVVSPAVQIGTAEVYRVLPPSLPIAVTQRTAGRFAGLLRALANADEELFRLSILDEVHVPYRRQLTEGIDAAMQAAEEAGAAGVTISGHGPSLLAMSTDPHKAEAAAAAMAQTLKSQGSEVETLLCGAWQGRAFPSKALNP